MSQPNRTMESKPPAAGQQQQQQHPSQVLHVRDNSDSDLQMLFSVLNKDHRPQQESVIPLKERNLPRSFFEPPRQTSHSRDGSRDSTNYGMSSVVGTPSAASNIPGLAPNHGRSQSLPAQLPLPLSAAPPQIQHGKQASVDFAEDMANLHLPPSQPNPSWDPKTGQQRYFGNSQEQSQWMKPGSGSTVAVANPHGGSTPQGTLSPAQSHTSSPSGSIHNLSSQLPPGWEQGITPDGEIYFINHLERTTSWFDPRIPKHLQRPGPMKIGSPDCNPVTLVTPRNPPPAQPAAPQPTPQQQQQQQATLPQQAPQQQQLPQQQQPPIQQISPGQQPQQPSSQPLVIAPAPGAQPVRQTLIGPSQPQYIQLELERLKQEKDRLQREQEEITRRELLLKMMTLPKQSPNTDIQTTQTPTPATIQSVSTSGVDPFLGQGSNNLESHARQNSGDSGLGGMGNNYSLPRTPEDFLSNVDEMDTQEGGQKQMVKPQSSDFNMNELQSGVCMDMGPLADAEQSGMESEDLVPSLQDINSDDLLNDVDVGKMDNLLWL